MLRERLLDGQLAGCDPTGECLVDFPVVRGLLARARLDDIEFASRRLDGALSHTLARAPRDVDGGEHVAHPARAGAEGGRRAGLVNQFHRHVDVVDERSTNEPRAVADSHDGVGGVGDFLGNEVGGVGERDVKGRDHDIARKHGDTGSLAGVNADDRLPAIAQRRERGLDRPAWLLRVGTDHFDAFVGCGVLVVAGDENARPFGNGVAGFHSRELDAALAEFGDDAVVEFEVGGGDDDHDRFFARISLNPIPDRTVFVPSCEIAPVSEPISTGCAALDGLLGGGLPRGSVTQVYGPPAAGKTNLALSAAVETAVAGELSYYIDTEGLSVARFEQLAQARTADLDDLASRIVIAEALDFDEQEEAVRDAEDLAERASLVVLDSATGFYRLERTNRDEGEALRQVGRQVTHLLSLARKHDLAVLLTNQVFADPDSESGRVRALGGNTLSHLTSVILRVERFRAGNRRATLEKHGSKAAGETCRFAITDNGLEGVEEGV